MVLTHLEKGGENDNEITNATGLLVPDSVYSNQYYVLPTDSMYQLGSTHGITPAVITADGAKNCTLGSHFFGIGIRVL